MQLDLKVVYFNGLRRGFQITVFIHTCAAEDFIIKPSIACKLL